VARGPGRDPAAQRRELPGLQEEAQRQAGGLQLLLERGAQHARLDARGLRHRIDLEDAVHAAHVDGDRAAVAIVAGRVDAADDARIVAAWARRGYSRYVSGAPTADTG